MPVGRPTWSSTSRRVYEGYITLAIAPLPRHYLGSIPVADQVKGQGFRPEEVAKVPTSGAFKFASVTPGAELRLEQERQLQELRDGQAGPPRFR